MKYSAHAGQLIASKNKKKKKKKEEELRIIQSIKQNHFEQLNHLLHIHVGLTLHAKELLSLFFFLGWGEWLRPVLAPARGSSGIWEWSSDNWHRQGRKLERMNLIDTWKRHWSQPRQRRREAGWEIGSCASEMMIHKAPRIQACVTSVQDRRELKRPHSDPWHSRKVEEEKEMRLSAKLPRRLSFQLMCLNTRWHFDTEECSLQPEADVHLATMAVIAVVWRCWLKPCLPPSRFLSGFILSLIWFQDLCLEY